jgi:Protein of unknown function (DUF2510)
MASLLVEEARNPFTVVTLRRHVTRARAEFLDREVDEADRLVAELTQLSRAARRRDRTGTPASNPDDAPSGWYPDPTGRHERRYWHEGRWTEHVANGGRRSADAPTPTPAP